MDMTIYDSMERVRGRGENMSFLKLTTSRQSTVSTRSVSFITQLVQYPAPASRQCSHTSAVIWHGAQAPADPAELRALLIHVYHRTWTGSRCMFDKMGQAWVRKLKDCVAAKGVFCE